MEHQTITPKHLDEEAERNNAPLLYRIAIRILEVSTMELIVGTAHLVLFGLVVFGVIGSEGGGH